MKSIGQYFSGLAQKVSKAFEESNAAQVELAVQLEASSEKTREEFRAKAADPNRSLISRIGYKIAIGFTYSSPYPNPMM